MDRLTIERVGKLDLYEVSYNGLSVFVPDFRIERAIRMLIRIYSARNGVGV